jgi:hypothetical protein
VRAKTPYPVAVTVWVAADSPEDAQGEAQRLFPGHDGAAAVVLVNRVAVDRVTVGEVNADLYATTRQADQATAAPDTGQLDEATLTLLAAGLVDVGAYNHPNLVAAARAFQEHRSVAAAVNAVIGEGVVEQASGAHGRVSGPVAGLPDTGSWWETVLVIDTRLGPEATIHTTHDGAIAELARYVGDHWHERFDRPRPADDRAAIDQYFEGNDREDYHVLEAERRP